MLPFASGERIAGNKGGNFSATLCDPFPQSAKRKIYLGSLLSRATDEWGILFGVPTEMRSSFVGLKKSGRGDSNPRSPAPKAGALNRTTLLPGCNTHLLHQTGCDIQL